MTKLRYAIGIDPGLRHTGLSAVCYDSSGPDTLVVCWTATLTITAEPGTPLPQAIFSLARDLHTAITDMRASIDRKLKCECVVIEEPTVRPYVSKHAMRSMAAAFAVAMSWPMYCGYILECDEISCVVPQRWKRELEWDGSVDRHVRFFPGVRLPSGNKAEHALDSIGLAVWWVRHARPKGRERVHGG